MSPARSTSLFPRTSTGAPRAGVLATLASGGLAALVALLTVAVPQPAYAAEAPVDLGTAESFAVLAATTVTNTGPTLVSGDLGVSPGTAVTGFPPGQVINGTQHSADAKALQAQSDLTTAYDDAAGRTPATNVTSDLGGQTLVGGVYRSATGMSLTGTVTLDAQGDPGSVFIFQAGSTLMTATSSTVALINGTQACNVYWQVGSSATVGTDTTFNGNILALTSITVKTGATVAGRVLARNGAVTLDTNTVTRPFCAAGGTPTGTPTATPTGTPTATPTGTPGGTPTGTPTGTPGDTPTGTPPGTPAGTPTGTPAGTPGDTATGSPTPSSPTGAKDTAMPTESTDDTEVAPPRGSGGSGDGSATGYFVPVGHPDTGLGGSPSPGRPLLAALGLATLICAGLAGVQALRRRRSHGIA